MKKKIKDLTEKEIIKICHRNYLSCQECELSHYLCSSGDHFEKKVEINESNND